MPFKELLAGSFENTQRWYRDLGARDQKLALGLLLFLAATGIFGLLLKPSWDYSHRARATLDKEQQLLQLMDRNANSIRQLNAARLAKTGSDTSLLALASKTAAEHELTLQRYEPGAGGKLGVWLSGADFNTLLSWLDHLTRQYKVRIERLSITASEQPGLVEAQIQLRE